MTVDAQSSGVVQGGSSITQQLAKNLVLRSNERTVEAQDQGGLSSRSGSEFHLQKRDILQLYLDRAYMGGGTYGVDAAARISISASRSAPSHPRRGGDARRDLQGADLSPHLNLPAARPRANNVLDNLVDAGYMTEGQVYGAPQSADAGDRRD